MTYDTNEYIFPKVLVLKTLINIIQTETFSPQYKYPFGEFASFHLFWGVVTKNDDLRRYFHWKSNRWDLLLAEKRQQKLRGQDWVKRVYEKKWWSEASEKNLNSTTSSSYTEPLASHLTIVCSEKKWRFQNFLLSKLQRREGYLTQNKKASVNTHCERFEPRSHFKSRLSLTVRVNVVLKSVVWK